MRVSGATKARGGLLVVEGLGAGLFVLHLVHLLRAGESLRTFLLGVLIPMVFTAGLLVGGIWLWRRDLTGSQILVVASWCLVGAGALSIAVALTIWYELAEGVVMSDPLYVVAGQASIGSAFGFVVGVYDVRQRAARARSEAMGHQLTVLNRVLRHDIRNGANVIVGVARLLSEETENEERTETIRRHALRLVQLGDHARDVERLLNEDDPALDTVDLVPLLDRELDRIEAEFPEAEIERSLPGSETVRAHPLIDSAITNVLENAVEHNDKRVPRIEVRCTRVSAEGVEFAEVRIADDGPGMPSDYAQVLERGYETPLGHTRGLGLWLVNWIVERSGGEVTFEENEPTGSVVRLRFRLST